MLGSRVAKKHCCRGRGKDFITDGAQLRAQRHTLDQQELLLDIAKTMKASPDSIRV